MRDETHSAFIRAFVALLVLVLGYALTVATRTALADVYAEPAKDFLETRRNAGEALTEDESQAVHDALSQALVLAPGDPENISELGRLYRILLEPADLTAEQISRYGDSATAYYKAALSRRPTWPWDWGDLARVKYEQYQDASDVYQAALVHAVEFGPREALLQDQIAWLGMNTWSVLRPPAALAVLAAADRALEDDAEALRWMFEDTGLWQPPCTQVSHAFTYLKRRCEELDLT